MAFLGKEYKFVKSENYEGYLKALGLPDDKIKSYVSSDIAEKMTKDGDTYTLHYILPEGNMEVSFKHGVELDEALEEGIPAKSTYTVDGNTINQVMKTKDAKLSIKKEFNGDDLVVTMTSDKWDGVARIYYKA